MAINWQQWGDAAFARAAAQQRPILLSLTATWCHACHRMDDETWDDPGVAAAVSRCAVPVRADCDERPDVYARYHLGGLPTTALLAPDGEFVRGGTFLSPAELLRFLDLSVADWRSGRRPAARTGTPSSNGGGLVDSVLATLIRRFDAEHGGFGLAPKVPETHALALVLRRWRRSRDDRLERIARASLDAIVEHLHDRRDGGFFRYAAAPDWTAPHTEKLALDQALIVELLLEAGVALDDSRYIDVARRALDHARRRLATDDGAVLSSVAADPDYDASGDLLPDQMPSVDARRFADASAAMNRAAALAFAVTGEDLGLRPEYLARSAAGRIPHRLDAPGAADGLLRDQALGVSAALAEYRLSGRPELLDWATRAVDWTVRGLWDEEAAAFRACSSVRGEPRLAPMFPLLANGEMAVALLDLADHTSNAAYRARAEALIQGLHGRAVRSPAGAALGLAALRREEAPPEADVAGQPGDPRGQALARAAVAALGPAVVVRWSAAARPGLVLCTNKICRPPVEDPRDLLDALVRLGLAPRGILTHWSCSIRH